MKNVIDTTTKSGDLRVDFFEWLENSQFKLKIENLEGCYKVTLLGDYNTSIGHETGGDARYYEISIRCKYTAIKKLINEISGDSYYTPYYRPILWFARREKYMFPYFLPLSEEEIKQRLENE